MSANSTLYVYGIPPYYKKEEIIEMFNEYGRCWVDMQRYSKFCYVEFENVEDAEGALESLNGYKLGKYGLSVKFYKHKSYESVKKPEKKLLLVKQIKDKPIDKIKP